MLGETDLASLLAALAPVLDPEHYTFATVDEATLATLPQPRAIFRETEGISVICSRHDAEAHKLKHEGTFGKITLSVHSSLAAVGLTARVSTALTQRGISCNMVAAFHHDHVFVPLERAPEALAILLALSA